MAKRSAKRIGLAIVGGGRVGLIRGEIAARHPQVEFIGLAEIKPDRAREVTSVTSPRLPVRTFSFAASQRRRKRCV